MGILTEIYRMPNGFRIGVPVRIAAVSSMSRLVAKWSCKPNASKMDGRFEIPLGLAKWTHGVFSLSKR
jgi:hypothetical protein